jgi:hypothetical protein
VTYAAAGSCTVSGATVHLTGAGSCAITAFQPGDANFNPSPTVIQSFTIAPESPSPGRVDGHNLRPANGGHAEVHVDGTGPGAPDGRLTYDPPGSGARYEAETITSFAIAADGHSATITGVDEHGTTFTAYVEDNGRGAAGQNAHDVFKLWIGGVLQTGDGSLDAGRIEISLD